MPSSFFNRASRDGVVARLTSRLNPPVKWEIALSAIHHRAAGEHTSMTRCAGGRTDLNHAFFAYKITQEGHDAFRRERRSSGLVPG